MSAFWDSLKYGLPTMAAISAVVYAKHKQMTPISTVGIGIAGWFAGYTAYRGIARVADGGAESLPRETATMDAGQQQNAGPVPTLAEVKAAVPSGDETAPMPGIPGPPGATSGVRSVAPAPVSTVGPGPGSNVLALRPTGGVKRPGSHGQFNPEVFGSV